MGTEVTDQVWVQIPDALVAFAPDGTVLHWNPAAEVVFGYPRERAIGQSLYPLIVPEDRADEERSMQALALTAGLAVFESVRRGRDGVPVQVSIATRAVLDDQQNLVYFLSSFRDVSHRRAPHDAELLAGMSHELRTPLNAIIGFTGTLLMQLPGPLNAEQEKQMRIVQTGARQLLALINHLLDRAEAAGVNTGRVDDR